MPDLDDRLRNLVGHVAPSRPPLDPVALDQAVSRYRRRRAAQVLAPAAVLVLMVGAFVAGRGSTDAGLRVDTVDQGPGPGPTGGDAGVGGPGSTVARAADQKELLDALSAIVDLREALAHERLDAASWAGDRNATVDLGPNRAATDAAVDRFETAMAALERSRSGPVIDDAQQQARRRLDSLPIVRRSVEARQTDAVRLIEQYEHMTADLASIEHAVLSSEQSPALFRPLVSHQNAATVTDAELAFAGQALIISTIGYFPTQIPAAAQPASRESIDGGPSCGDDAAAAGAACPVYEQLLRRRGEVATGEKTFDDWATPDEKQTARRAMTGTNDFDLLARALVDDGATGNDLTGVAPGSIPVDPVTWRRAVDQRLAARFALERSLLAPLR